MKSWPKWLRRLALAFLALVLAIGLCWGSMVGLMLMWVAKPPSIAAQPALMHSTSQKKGDRVFLGKNWLGQREGLPVLYLTGAPLEMGYANGVLTQELIHRQEDTVLGMFNKVAPWRWTQFLIKFLMVWKNRDLPEHIIPEHQLEILGLSLGCPDAHPDAGPYYHRLLNYHGAQDISYMLMNSPLIRRGCTAFGAWGPKTRDRHLLLGRNFDWEAAPVFDQDRLVILCEPDQGIPFISLAWAGMAGCVSGMNREGLSVTVNGAPSKLPDTAATPTCLIAREILQHASSIPDAIKIIKQRQVFVSAMFLVGSKKDGRFVIVEKTPERVAVREPSGETPYLICANHYMTPELENEPVNKVFMNADTSVSRYSRMEELLKSPALLDESECVRILRDRRLPGATFPGNGHRSTLNPLIATHAVVMDLTDGIFWAASSPHQLGKFVAFSVGEFSQTLPDRMVPEDSFLTSGEFKTYRNSVLELDEGWQAIKRRNYEQAYQSALKAEKDNPGFYLNSWLLAEVLHRLGRNDEAQQFCSKALASSPALAVQRQKIEQLARQIAQEHSSHAPKH